ncbi:MAG TPA: hypothetical protein VMV46_18090 [Thermoanaerobaculia bacterium]|nr:hypothetical protein [Thermoanaerobaculia bacterium]
MGGEVVAGARQEASHAPLGDHRLAPGLGGQQVEGEQHVGQAAHGVALGRALGEAGGRGGGDRGLERVDRHPLGVGQRGERDEAVGLVEAGDGALEVEGAAVVLLHHPRRAAERVDAVAPRGPRVAVVDVDPGGPLFHDVVADHPVAGAEQAVVDGLGGAVERLEGKAVRDVEQGLAAGHEGQRLDQGLERRDGLGGVAGERIAEGTDLDQGAALGDGAQPIGASRVGQQAQGLA